MNQGQSTPIWPLGGVKVVTPGTLVGLLDGFAAFKQTAGGYVSAGGGIYQAGQTPYRCHKIVFQVDPANVGKTYVGVRNFVRGTKVGLIYSFPPGNLLSAFDWAIEIPGSRNDIEPENYYVDADTANDQLIVTCYMVGSR